MKRSKVAGIQLKSLIELKQYLLPLTMPTTLTTLTTTDGGGAIDLRSLNLPSSAIFIPMEDVYGVEGACMTGPMQLEWMRQLVMWYVREFTLHVDSKFKLHHGDWVLTSVGTHHIRWDPHNLCLSNQFVPLVYLMCKQHESEGAGRLLLDALNKVCVKYFGKKLEPGATMSDHAAGLKKAFVTVFPDVYHGQCWPHIIRKWGEGEWASKRWEHFDEVGTQLTTIHLAQTTMMRDLLMMEYGVMWDEWGHEMDVFWDSHCRPGKDGPNSGWDNWSIGCFDCVLCTPSQQAQESWHKQLLTTKIPGLGKGSTETVFHKMLPQLIEMDAIMIPTLLCFEVPGVPVEMIKKALWYVDNQNTHIHVFKHDGDDGAHGYYILRRDHETGVTKITKRLIDMFRMAWQGDVDPRVQDLDHLVDICQGIHVVEEQQEGWPVPRCYLNPAQLDCVGCKGFKSHGICSHVLALNHILKATNLRREVMEIGKSGSKTGGGNQKKPVPALTRAPQREPDSSDEEEERLLALGAQGR